ASRVIDAKVEAKLGQGDIKGSGKLTLSGATAASAEFSVSLGKVSPIGAIEPQISADISGQLAYGDHWTGKVSVRRGAIKIPSTERDAILDTGAPSDMLFVDAPPPIVKGGHRAAPSHPWLVATVDVGPIQVDADNVRDVANGHMLVDGQL